MNVSKLPKLSQELYLFLSFTWGILATLIGCIVAGALYVIGEEPHKNRLGWVFKVTWVKGAGVSFGPFAVTPKKPSSYLLQHEFGHSIQNCFLGPFCLRTMHLRLLGNTSPKPPKNAH